MIEIPESIVIASQAAKMLSGRKVTEVFNATYLHKFAWFVGDPENYGQMLVGKRFCSAEGNGAFVDLELDGGLHMAVSDGVNMRYCTSDSEIPAKYQLLITLDNGNFLVFTVAMYGGIYVGRNDFENSYYQGARNKPSPLSNMFDDTYYKSLFAGVSEKYSVKAFLATEQRIPGLGNGVLQDILFRSGLHPKRKLSSLNDSDRELLFNMSRLVLSEMTRCGGRNTEKDLFGNLGGYQVLLCRNTYTDPCPVCGGNIIRENYMGGAVYYCPMCQPLK